jgi:hypothetical protein
VALASNVGQCLPRATVSLAAHVSILIFNLYDDPTMNVQWKMEPYCLGQHWPTLLASATRYGQCHTLWNSPRVICFRNALCPK